MGRENERELKLAWGVKKRDGERGPSNGGRWEDCVLSHPSPNYPSTQTSPPSHILLHSETLPKSQSPSTITLTIPPLLLLLHHHHHPSSLPLHPYFPSTPLSLHHPTTTNLTAPPRPPSLSHPSTTTLTAPSTTTLTIPPLHHHHDHHPSSPPSLHPPPPPSLSHPYTTTTSTPLPYGNI